MRHNNARKAQAQENGAPAPEQLALPLAGNVVEDCAAAPLNPGVFLTPEAREPFSAGAMRRLWGAREGHTCGKCRHFSRHQCLLWTGRSQFQKQWEPNWRACGRLNDRQASRLPWDKPEPAGAA